MSVNTGADPHHTPLQAPQFTPEPAAHVMEKDMWDNAHAVTAKELQTPAPSAIEEKYHAREAIHTIHVPEKETVCVWERDIYTVRTVTSVLIVAETERRSAANAAEPEI